MIIKEIELNNFRIYKGIHKIELTSEDKKNIFIISGRNGFGKTTFLMALVWTLYGKQMQEVDDLYQKEISEQGGYSKYIANSLNRMARREGETFFSVSITFANVNLPDILCKEIKITRSFDVEASSSDSVDMLIDGRPSALAKESGTEMFIRDFLLPKEIAKFFFFDAEKIVTLAEINTAEQRRKLSEAYSEVLGIKKYEDLKSELEGIQIRLRQESASKKEREQLIQLQADMDKCDIEIADREKRISEYRDQVNAKRLEGNQIQEKLIRAGSTITLEQLNSLRGQEEELNRKQDELQNELKNSFEVIPFAVAGEKFLEVSKQLENESNYKMIKFKNDNVNDITNKVLTDLLTEPRPTEILIDARVHDYFAKTFERLIRKHFFADTPDLPVDFKILHEFSDTEKNELNGLLTSIKLGFRETFKRINGDYNQSRNELNGIKRRIKDAETNLDDPIIAEFRKRREELEREVIRLEDTLADLHREIGQYNNEKVQSKKRIEELARKLEVSDANKGKDETASRLITNLKEFITNFKEEKKKSLESQILKGLETLMHKRGFIKKVKVEIIGDDIDILLYDGRGEEIRKEILSKGEQQMYATALLRGLVEESDIDFPVFIDSPMQKFDEQHAENIVKYFYPNVSDQVVIFPLINKELNAREYEILLPNISKTFLIHNLHEDKSEFLEVSPKEFLNTYNKMYNNAN